MTSTPFPNSRTYSALAAACGALLLYGCFVPFEFQSMPLRAAVERFGKVLSEPIEPKPNSDWLINLAMFMPFGFLWCGGIGVDRSKAVQCLLLVASIPVLVVFSSAIEFTQLYIPKRTSSVQDVAANTVGGTAGGVCWLLFGNAFTDTLRRIEQFQGTRNIWRKLVPVYLFGMAVLHCTPFDVCDFGFLKIKWKDGGIRFIPFEFPAHAPAEFRKAWQDQFLEKAFFNMGYFLPAGIILAGLGWPRGDGNRTASKVLAIGFAFAAVIECLQFPIFSRSFEATDILTGGLAVGFGWTVSRLATAPDGSIRLRGLILSGWVAGLILMNWLPFDFAANAQETRSNRAGFNWMPFRDYYEHDYVYAFNKMFQKMLVFVPVGVLLTPRQGRLPWFAVALPATLFAVGIEIGQNYLPGHYPTISDILIEPCGAVAGMLLMRLVQRRPAPSENS